MDQVISAGGFNVHCTQAAESAHKLCMHVASLRVRHQTINETQESMLRYLCLRTLFDSMSPAVRHVSSRKLSTGVSVHLCQMRLRGLGFLTERFQETLLHREARVARVELLDLICDKFDLPRLASSYLKLDTLRYTIGQKFVRSDGFVIWATDSQYNMQGDTNKRRRDVLFVKGFDTKEGPTGTRTPYALCCEAICFVTVSLVNAQFPIPETMLPQIVHNSITFILGRWFEPHSESVTRDKSLRPVCPGPLHINHCLWKYARADNCRKALVSRSQPTPAFRRQADLFGDTPLEQARALAQEKRAYYCMIPPGSVLSRANMCPAFVPNTCTFDLNTWIQTVTLV